MEMNISSFLLDGLTVNFMLEQVMSQELSNQLKYCFTLIQLLTNLKGILSELFHRPHDPYAHVFPIHTIDHPLENLYPNAVNCPAYSNVENKLENSTKW